MIRDVLRTGDKIEIVTLTKLSKRDVASFSLVQDINADDSVLITLPMLEGNPVVLEPEQVIRINFFRANGEFFFDAKVVGRVKSGLMVLFKVVQISPVEKLQRRNDFRLKTVLQVKFRCISGKKGEDVYYKAHAMDISGGGIRLYTEQSIDVKSSIECKIKLLDKQEVILNGTVLRVNPVQDAEKHYDIGVSFVDMPEKTKEKIISFIFSQQRKLRSKGF